MSYLMFRIVFQFHMFRFFIEFTLCFFPPHIKKRIVPFLTLSHLCCIYLCLHHILIGYSKQNMSITIQNVCSSAICYVV